MADGCVPVVVSPVPFSRQIHDLTVREGVTVLAMLVEAVRSGMLAAADLSRTTIYVDGERLDREEALETVLTAGSIINVVVEPLGGGGGGGKDIGQIVLTIAVIVVSAWVGGPTGPMAAMSALVRTVASAAVMAVGQAAIGALFAPDRDAQAKANDRYALQSASNQYRPWSPFPMALGEVIVAPDLAVKTFTQSRGDDVWIYGILGLHYGACEVSEEKIGDTLASTMGAGDVQFVHHLTPGPRNFRLYPNDVDQLDLTEELEATTSTATPVLRAGSSEGEKFEFDFFLPQGLHFQKDDGRVITAAVTMTVRYRAVDEDGHPIGAGTWSNGLTIPLSSTTKEPWRVTRALSLPMGRYEFEIKRSLKPDGNEKRRDQVALTAIRSIAFRKPISDETLSVIEFAVRATALNQGTLAPITCRIKPVCQTWDAGAEAWTAPVTTSNPAALVRWLLNGPAPVRPESAERVDLGLRAWSELCETYNWTTNVYLTEQKTQAEAMALLEQAGRASLFWDGTQIVSSPWVEKPSPVQLFAGDNLRDHKWSMTYVEPVHALRVEFQNLDHGGEPDELYVYADGYAETAGGGKEAAVLIEALRVEGQKTEERAYRDGRWELGRRKHQRRVDTWACDIEQLASRYGSRVRLAWQRVDSGASARVRVRRWSGGLVTGLRLTQPVTMLPGESYAVDLRLVAGVDAAVPVINAATTEPVTTRDITFAAPRVEASAPRGGDLVAFGIATKVSEDVEIIGIEPGEGLTATLTGIRYVAPLLMAGETGPIPELQTRLSRDRAANPPPPRLLGVQPDPSGVRLSFEIPSWSGSPITGFSARWRSTPAEGQESGWQSLAALDASARTLLLPSPRALAVAIGDLEGATLVDVEIRAITAAGQTSPVPLLVEAIEVREDPHAPTGLTVTPVIRNAPDGSSHGTIVVAVDALEAAAGVDLVVEVRREPVTGSPDQWENAGLVLPAKNPTGDIPDLRSGERYRVRTAWRSAAGWPSEWAVSALVTVPAGSSVSHDTVNIGGEPVLEFKGRLVSVEDLSASNAAAVADIMSGFGTIADAVEQAEVARDQTILKAGEVEDGVAAVVANAEIAVAAKNAAGDFAFAAQGAATTVTTLAGEVATHHTQTVEARDDAEGFAGAASIASGTAVAAKKAAGVVVSAAFPEIISGEWLSNIDGILGPPGGLPSAPGGQGDITNGVWTSATGVNTVAVYKAVVPWSVGKIYEVQVEVEAAAGSGGDVLVYTYAKPLSSTYEQPASPDEYTNAIQAPVGVRTTITRRFGLGVLPVGGTQINIAGGDIAFVRFGGLFNYGSAPDRQSKLHRLSLRDVTSEVAAAGSAATALVHQSSAAADAAAASISANIAASLGADNANPNSRFSNWTGAAPVSWSLWTPANGTLTKVAGRNGQPNSARLSNSGSANVGLAAVQTRATVTGGEYVILTAELTLVSGSLQGAAIYFDARTPTASANYVVHNLAAIKDATGVVRGAGVVGQTYRFSILRDARAANVDRYDMLAVNRWSGFSPAGAAVIDWHAVGWRPATPEEIAAGQEIPAIQAALVITAKTTAGSTGQVALDVTGGAGGDPFNIEMLAGPAGSSVSFTATEIALKNVVDGVVVPALTVRGGHAMVSGNLSVTSGIYLGSGTVWSLQLRSQPFVRGDGETISFGGADIGIPSYEFLRDGLLPLAAGEAYDLRLTGLTGAGATVYAKIKVPGTPGGESIPATSAPSASGPKYQLLMGSRTESASGQYAIQASGYSQIRLPAGSSPEDRSGVAAMDVYVRKAGVWTRAGSLDTYWSIVLGNPGSSPIIESVFWTISGSMQLGSGVEGIGGTLTAHGSFPPTLVGELTAFGPVSWATEGTPGGVRSALPPGGKTTIRITPQG